MPVVGINIIKEWFKNLKKPTQEQFWVWLDSFRHKWEKVPLDDVENLTTTLQNKADLVNGVVPESQLPFTINTNEVVAIGAITVTANNVHIAVHGSGKNTVRINGIILNRAFPDDLPFVPVTEGNKFLRIVARNEPGLFFLKQSAESDEPQEPSLDPGEVHVRLILITPTGAFIDPQVLNGFKEKSEDNWKTFFPNKLSIYNLTYSDTRDCLSLDETIPSSVTKEIRTIQFSQETNRDVEFTIKNNSAGPVVIQGFQTENLNKGFANENLPFTIPTKGTVFAKYNHVKNVIEILKVGSADFTFVTDATLQGNGITGSPAGLSVAKNAEIAGKLTKPAESTAEKVINADGTTTAKSDFESTKYVAVTLPATALEVWKGLIVYFSGSGALTIPNSLSDGWTINGITELSTTLSLSLASGKTWRFGTPEAIPEKQIFTITQKVNNIYLLGV